MLSEKISRRALSISVASITQMCRSSEFKGNHAEVLSRSNVPNKTA